ncbi:MAG TPA: ATP-binding cassette domain-containing protein [Candidatus Lustribacter sp.]
MLEVVGVEAGYGRGKTVLHGVDLNVAAGELALLMGHNGAGKTTLLRTVFGELQPTNGTIRFQGEILRGSSAARVRSGISYTAGGRAVFAGLTVNENLAVSASVVENDRKKIAQRRDFVLDAFPDLQRRLDQVAGSMSGGQQRMLAVSMAVMQEPRLLLLDEPSLGIAPVLVERLYRSIADIRNRLGLAVLVVEQTINPSVLAADRVSILRMGEVVFRGAADALADSEHLWSML